MRFLYNESDSLIVPTIDLNYTDYYLAPDTLTNTTFTDSPYYPVEVLDYEGNKILKNYILQEPKYEGVKFNSLYSGHLNNRYLNGFCYLVADWATKFEYKNNPYPVDIDVFQIMDLNWTLLYFSESQLQEWMNLPTYEDELGHVIT